MIWLTWRQFRAQAATAGVLVAALAVALVIVGRPLVQPGAGPTGTDTALYFGGIVVVYALPGLIGAFWGAPLVARELEAGTHRLVWNQTVTRTRWLLTKLAVTGLGAVAAAGLLSLAVSWWAGPLDAASRPSTIAGDSPAESITARLSPWVFGARGIVPLGYAAFAFALGVAAGILLRRTVLAMAVTLGVFIAVQLAMPLAVRPHVVPPVSETVTITSANLSHFGVDSGAHQIEELRVAEPPGAWVLSNQTVDARGRAVRPPSWLIDCAVPPGAGDQPLSAWQHCFTKLAEQGYRQQLTYQPAGRFWSLQGAETGIYLALSALLGGLCVRWTRRRLS